MTHTTLKSFVSRLVGVVAIGDVGSTPAAGSSFDVVSGPIGYDRALTQPNGAGSNPVWLHHKGLTPPKIWLE
jgi:hypothetical protein